MRRGFNWRRRSFRTLRCCNQTSRHQCSPLRGATTVSSLCSKTFCGSSMMLTRSSTGSIRPASSAIICTVHSQLHTQVGAEEYLGQRYCDRTRWRGRATRTAQMDRRCTCGRCGQLYRDLRHPLRHDLTRQRRLSHRGHHRICGRLARAWDLVRHPLESVARAIARRTNASGPAFNPPVRGPRALPCQGTPDWTAQWAGCRRATRQRPGARRFEP